MAPVLTDRFRGRTMKEIDEATPYYAEGTSERSQGDEEADTRQVMRAYPTGEPHPTLSRYLGTITDVKSLQEDLGEEESDLLGVSLTQEIPEQVLVPLRQTETEWISSHSDELKVYGGQWIVVEDRKLVAHDFDFAKVVNEARLKGIEIPYVTKVEGEKETPFVG